MNIGSVRLLRWPASTPHWTCFLREHQHQTEETERERERERERATDKIRMGENGIRHVLER